MIRRIRLVGLTAALLVIFSPSPALAQNFGVSPPEVKIDNLSPGKEAEFSLTIHNKDGVNHIFTLATCNPEESQRRPGRTEFPNDGWISFSPQEIEVAANSKGIVKVTVAIPSKQKWAGKDWEVWLGVAPKSSDLLTVKLYVRLLVSTSKAVEAGPNMGLIVGIAIGMLLLSYAVYYFRRRAKSKHQP